MIIHKSSHSFLRELVTHAHKFNSQPAGVFVYCLAFQVVSDPAHNETERFLKKFESVLESFIVTVYMCSKPSLTSP